MKILMTIVTLFFATSGYASTYVCQIEGTDETLTLIKGAFKPSDKEDEQDRYDFTVQIQTSELAFPSLVKNGVGKDVDDRVLFTSSDNTVTVDIDGEFNTYTLILNGQTKSLINCQFF